MNDSELKKAITDLLLKNHPAEDKQFNHFYFLIDSVKEIMRDKINHEISTCSLCKECKNSKFKTGIIGNVHSPVLIVTEGITEQQYLASDDSMMQAPLENTDEYTYFIDSLAEAGIDVNKLCMMNAVNCFSSTVIDGQVIPCTAGKEQASTCAQFVKHAIFYLQPILVILAGNFPLNSLYPGEKILDSHGEIYPLSFTNTKIAPIYSPSFVYQTRGEYEKDFKKDILNIANYLANEYPSFKIVD